MSTTRQNNGKAVLAAAKANRIDIVSHLINTLEIDFTACENVQEGDYIDFNALDWAVENNNPAMIVLLAKAGAKLTSTSKGDVINADHDFETIERAADEDKWECVIALAENITESYRDQYHFGGALLMAVSARRVDVVYALLKAKASHNWICIERDKSTSLHIAVLQRDIPMIQLLVMHAPELLDKENNHGLTPMTLASQKEYWDLIPALTGHFTMSSDDFNNAIDNYSRPVFAPTLEFFKLKAETNKAALLDQIMSIPDAARRQRALWQSLVPNTHLGSYFHVQRGLFPPNFLVGTLSRILTNVKALVQESGQLHIDEDVKTALMNAMGYLAYGYLFQQYSSTPPAANNHLPPAPPAPSAPPAAPALMLVAATQYINNNDRMLPVVAPQQPVVNADIENAPPPKYEDVQHSSLEQIIAMAPQVPVGLLSQQSMFPPVNHPDIAVIPSAPVVEQQDNRSVMLA